MTLLVKLVISMITKTQQYLLNKLSNKLKQHIIVDENSCWLWQVNINRNGYGRIYAEGKRSMAHIFIYKLLKGGYRKDLKLDHVYCIHRNCCNPTHLSPVTSKVNAHRGKAILYK